MGDIVHEVETLAADGVSEITLLGQNVNSYGRDLGAGQYRPEFADLLRTVDAIDGIERIRFTSPHPKDLRPETIAAMAECASVCEHLHLPLQSGSDRTLARMHRGYTADALPRAPRRRACRDPGPRGHHRHHRRLPGRDRRRLRRARSKSSPTPTTTPRTRSCSRRDPAPKPATLVDDFVPAAVVHERMQQLTEVVEGSALRRHEARLGAVEEVLLDGPSKKDAAVWSGRSRHNKLVHVAPPAGTDFAAGEFVTARVTARRTALAAGRLRRARAARRAGGGYGSP